jgi:selenocysteine-specific translation elongation factor
MLVAVLSDKPELREQFCKLAAGEAAKGDITFYPCEAGITLVEPTLYPEKIQPLLYSLSMADYAVLLVDGLSPKVGELIIALNSMRVGQGAIVSNVPLPISGTVLDKYEKLPDMAAAAAKVKALQPEAAGEQVVALVHKAEQVKSVGHVAHGVVKSGRIRKEDVLFALPEKKEIAVRGLLVSGKEAGEAAAGEQVSVVFSGEPFERGILAPLRNEYEVNNVVNGKFARSPFFRDELKGKIHAYTNMQFVEGVLNDSDLTLSQPLAFEKGEQIVIVDASNQKLRIAGVFQSKW